MYSRVEIDLTTLPIKSQARGERKNVRSWMFGDGRERKTWMRSQFGSLGTVATGTSGRMNQCCQLGTVAIETSDVMSPQEKVSDGTGMIAWALAGTVKTALEETGMIGLGGTGRIVLVVIGTGTGMTVLAAEMNVATLEVEMTGVFVYHFRLLVECKK